MYGKYLFIIISLKNIRPFTTRVRSSATAETKTEKFIGEYGGVYTRILLY